MERSIVEFARTSRELAKQIIDDLLPRLEKTSRKMMDESTMRPLDAGTRGLILGLVDGMLSNVAMLETGKQTLTAAQLEHRNLCMQIEGIVSAHLLDVGFDAAIAKPSKYDR